MAVVGAGAFGKNHLRVLHESHSAELVAVVDIEFRAGSRGGSAIRMPAFPIFASSVGTDRRGVVAAPTSAHADIGCAASRSAVSMCWSKSRSRPTWNPRNGLIDAAEANGRILQVGHLERFNPGVQAVQQKVTLPLFFEIHRMSMFSPRSLDVDVVLDLMIHDIDVVLALTGLEPEEIRAAGIRILSDKVDIANVRLGFPGRVRREPYRQPGLDRKDSQNSLIPAASIHLARLSAAGCGRVHCPAGPADWVRFVCRRKGRAAKFEIEAFLHAYEPDRSRRYR